VCCGLRRCYRILPPCRRFTLTRSAGCQTKTDSNSLGLTSRSGESFPRRTRQGLIFCCKQMLQGLLRVSPPVRVYEQHHRCGFSLSKLKFRFWKRQNVLHRDFPQVQSLDMEQNLAQSATFWTSFLPKPFFGRWFGRVSCPIRLLGDSLDEHISYKTSTSALISARS
jgi:hypothetical protein